jgi:hypothetical protein
MFPFLQIFFRLVCICFRVALYGEIYYFLLVALTNSARSLA